MDVQLTTETTSYGVLFSSPRHNPFSQVRCSYIYDGFAVYATVTYCQLKRDCVVSCIGVDATEDAGDASPAIFGQPGTKCLIYGTPPRSLSKLLLNCLQN